MDPAYLEVTVEDVSGEEVEEEDVNKPEPEKEKEHQEMEEDMEMETEDKDDPTWEEEDDTEEEDPKEPSAMEKKYLQQKMCPVCKKKFSTSNNLRKHVNSLRIKCSVDASFVELLHK